MKKLATMLAITLAVAATVGAGTPMAKAYWTGRSWNVETVTHRRAWKCEYNYNGQLIYRLFENACASSIDVY